MLSQQAMQLMALVSALPPQMDTNCFPNRSGIISINTRKWYKIPVERFNATPIVTAEFLPQPIRKFWLSKNLSNKGKQGAIVKGGVLLCLIDREQLDSVASPHALTTSTPVGFFGIVVKIQIFALHHQSP